MCPLDDDEREGQSCDILDIHWCLSASLPTSKTYSPWLDDYKRRERGKEGEFTSWIYHNGVTLTTNAVVESGTSRREAALTSSMRKQNKESLGFEHYENKVT